jgi:hypothetical protein
MILSALKLRLSNLTMTMPRTLRCYFPDLLTEDRDVCTPRHDDKYWVKKRSRKCILCFRWGLTFCSPSATT